MNKKIAISKKILFTGFIVILIAIIPRNANIALAGSIISLLGIISTIRE